MLGWEAEDHCRVWGKDHTPGKGGAELRAGSRREQEGLGDYQRQGWRYRQNPSHLLLLEGMKGRRKEGKGRAGKEGKKEERKYKTKKQKNNVCLPLKHKRKLSDHFFLLTESNHC